MVAGDVSILRKKYGILMLFKQEVNTLAGFARGRSRHSYLWVPMNKSAPLKPATAEQSTSEDEQVHKAKFTCSCV